MDRIFQPTEGKPEATAGNRWQPAGLALMGQVPSLSLMDAAVVARASFSGVLSYAVMQCGADDQDLAEGLHISKGYMSRFLREVGEAWAKRLVRFMRATGSLAPLQWIADQLGCDVVPRAAAEARIRELQAELSSLTGRRAA